MGRGKKWSDEDISYLKEKWGTLSISSISKNLNRSISAIKNQVTRLSLGPYIENDIYLTIGALIEGLGQKTNYSATLEKLERYNCPFRKKLIFKKKIRVIDIEEFWKWAYKNRTVLDFSKFENGDLGPEPKWVDKKRQHDRYKKIYYKKTPWTKEEDKKLVFLLKQHKYNRKDLAKKFNRSQGAIEKRIYELNIKERPISYKHNRWTKEEFELLVELLKDGYDYEMISEIMNKSSKGIRNRVYTMYLTENIDKVLNYIGDGTWGDGRPDLNIFHKKLTIKEKNKVNNDLCKFVEILNNRKLNI